MTRKDYQAVATIIAIIGDSDRGVLLTQAEVACGELEKNNPRFDRERFCGYVLGVRERAEKAIEEVR